MACVRSRERKRESKGVLSLGIAFLRISIQMNPMNYLPKNKFMTILSCLRPTTNRTDSLSHNPCLFIRKLLPDILI